MGEGGAGARRQAVVRNRPEGILGDVKGKAAEKDEEGEEPKRRRKGGGDATKMQ